MKKLVCLVLTFMLVSGMGLTFALSPAEELAQDGIMTGDDTGDFQQEQPVSRAELAKMLVLSRGEQPEGTAAFTDVPSSHWASAYIAQAVADGFINGYEDGSFRPDDPVTYEDAVKMVLAAYGCSEAYPFGYMSTAMDAGYLDGIPAVMGRAATRGDVAALLVNVRHGVAQEGMQNGNPYSSGYGIGGGGSGGSASPNITASVPAFAPGGAVLQESASGDGGGIAGYVPYFEDYMGVHNTEEYVKEEENRFKDVRQSPVSTFSIDVDTASYSNMRRFLSRGTLPQLGAVRTEELINYFSYDFPQPEDGRPLAVSAEVGTCPWNPDNQLAMVTMRGKELTQRSRQNLVFLIDVSGSMFSKDKLPLVQKAMGMLVENLTEEDSVSIVTYAGNTSVRLAGAPGNEKERILDVINGLQAGGSTAGGAGIMLAYDTAAQNMVEGNNRVILCTDGDFNVGISSTAELEALITQKRDSGIYLSVLGFGTGNYKDSRMETLADKGNGNYAYIDNIREAKKVLVDDMTKTLFTVANDVKLQIEFNPQHVSQYRLVGYENRVLQAEDFADDTKDAGELGAGQSVTAFYELVMTSDEPETEEQLRYQAVSDIESEELLCVDVRYKLPGQETSELLSYPILMQEGGRPSEDFRFASAVAGFGMYLNESEFLHGWTLEDILQQAEGAVGEDTFHLRNEFVQLVGMARYLQREKTGGTVTNVVRPW